MLSPLVQIAAVVVGVVGAMLAAGLLVCVPRERLTAIVLRARLRTVAPYVGILVIALGINKLVRPILDETSWGIGINATGWIYEIERAFVPALQGALPSEALVYFSLVYVFGYTFLLVFPLIAYLVLPSLRPLKRLLIAYAVNYVVGVVFYTLVIAYGPRNVMPEAVNQPLYELYPQVMFLTSSVNTSTNVFPSLHTSMSVTVLVFAWLTRDQLPRWLPIAAALATSVVLSTMALGIHWLTDVVAGVLLAAGSVVAASRIVADSGRPSGSHGGNSGSIPTDSSLLRR